MLIESEGSGRDYRQCGLAAIAGKPVHRRAAVVVRVCRRRAHAAGHVASFFHKQIAQQSVAGLEGVDQINNQIIVM